MLTKNQKIKSGLDAKELKQYFDKRFNKFKKPIGA